ncbi:alpha-E domain-containing protein [Oscillatoria amoena NRMC-F 0135]|nr:alpha-E domain-containing protein [Oscillatoria laete-virens]MDL5048021.1 alpha-E domain-containing protein [Oscillatoria amoena NRMC-F 0135]MDL5052504.1 alpha-E domain-containing protein [Oscillatoria laete-virens NRMC-F 0139]
MLSRVAECLFWMSRHVERAEELARLVEVNTHLMLDIPLSQSREIARNWLPLVDCLGEKSTFRKLGYDPDQDGVTEFLVFSRENTNSIASCVAAARENTRSVREQISEEMWEDMNRFYLWLMSKQSRQLFERNPYGFFREIIRFSNGFRGVTDSTIDHSEGWEFIQIGRYIERADKTTRVLDDKYHLLTLRKTEASAAIVQWNAILRNRSASQAYQRLYRAEVVPRKVAELLLLSNSFPRAVLHCVRRIDWALRRLSGAGEWSFLNAPEKTSGRLVADLSFSEVDEIFDKGLHVVVDQIQTSLNRIGAGLYDCYITYTHPRFAPSSLTTTASSDQGQQQQ